MTDETRRRTKGHERADQLPFDAIVALGSNVGDKRANIARAIGLLTGAGDVRLVARSRDYLSPPWGVTGQDWFVNACIGVATWLSPRELLARCQEIERALGRVRTLKWGPRVIDLDILVFGDLVQDEPELTLPHPYITDRAFVLKPLVDIAPGVFIRGRPAAAWLDDLPHADVVAMS